MSIGGNVCGSTKCKKYNICKRAICEENKWYNTVNWHDYGSASFTEDGIEETWFCGEYGNYALFVPLDEPNIKI